MKLIAPDYYKSFKCTAGRCRHTCCVGWEIDIDETSLARFRTNPEIAEHIVQPGFSGCTKKSGPEAVSGLCEDEEAAVAPDPEVPHFRLLDGEKCPFLNGNGLCDMILKYGEDYICNICRDHPRFRNFWSDRVEVGLGLVCEEAARIILTSSEPMTLVELKADEDVYTADQPPAKAAGQEARLTDAELALLALRENLLSSLTQTGPEARLLEYLIYRHLPDALYDGDVQKHIDCIQNAYDSVMDAFDETDGSIDSFIECARIFSYDNEYNEQ